MIGERDRVTLVVEGREFAGWVDVTVQLGIDRISGAFSVGLTERWPGSVRRAIRIEDSCQLYIGQDLVITGQIDDVDRQLGPDTHEIKVVGRDAAGELVDCACEHVPGEWTGRTLESIAADVCAPFGIKIRVLANTGKPFAKMTVNKGETCFELIKRMCGARGVLAYSDGSGDLIIGPGEPVRVPTILAEGINVKSVGNRDTRQNRWRDYTVLAQSGGWDAATNAGSKGKAQDIGIRRYRPRVRMAEDMADGVTAADQAKWEMMTNRARAEAAEVTFAGWRHQGGLWRPGALVAVSCPTVLLDGERLLGSVDLSHKLGDGTVAKLSLVGKGAYDLLAEKEAAGGGDAAW